MIEFDSTRFLKSLTVRPGVYQMKDADGQTIPRQIINSFSAKFNGKEVFQMDLEPSISTNPYIVFQYKAKESGKFDFEWVDDNGEIYSISKEMAVS